MKTKIMSKEIKNQFTEACSNGDLDTVKNLLVTGQYKFDEYEPFYIACRNENIKIVDYLLEYLHTNQDLKVIFNDALCFVFSLCLQRQISYFLTHPKFKEFIDIHIGNDLGLDSAVAQGNLALVKYLLTAPELDEHADIHANNDSALVKACIFSHFHIVEYFLTSTDLTEEQRHFRCIDLAFQKIIKDYQDVELIYFFLTNPIFQSLTNKKNNNWETMIWAAKNDKLELINRMLNNIIIKKTINFHEKDDMLFKTICNYQHTELIERLILEDNFPLTKDIELFLQSEAKFANFLKIFKRRDLHDKFQKQLSLNSNKKTLVKI